MIALRIKQPDRQRPWTGPGSIKVTGHQLPVYSVVGGIGTGIAFIVVNVLNVTTLIAGSIWLVVGVVSYVLYRRNQGLSLTQTTKVVMPKPIVEHEVEYPEAVNTAIKLAAPGRRAIHVLVTITVPASAPVDAAMLDRSSRV